MMRLLAVVFLLPTIGCSSYLVESMDGVWAGTATDQTGTLGEMTANFTWDVDGEYLNGVVEIGGWIYEDVYLAESDNEYAHVQLWLNTDARKVDLVTVAVGKDSMSGGYEVNTCWSADGQTLDDPALCIQTGTFELDRQ